MSGVADRWLWWSHSSCHICIIYPIVHNPIVHNPIFPFAYFAGFPTGLKHFCVRAHGPGHPAVSDQLVPTQTQAANSSGLPILICPGFTYINLQIPCPYGTNKADLITGLILYFFISVCRIPATGSRSTGWNMATGASWTWTMCCWMWWMIKTGWVKMSTGTWGFSRSTSNLIKMCSLSQLTSSLTEGYSQVCLWLCFWCHLITKPYQKGGSKLWL